MKRFWETVLIIFVFTIILSTDIYAANIEDNIDALIKWCENEGGIIQEPAGDGMSDWYAFGAARYGYKADYSRYLDDLEKYVNENGINDAKATEYHRTALAVLACGGNPRSFAGMDLIKAGIYGRNEDNPLDGQGINGLIFGLLALDSGKYEVPADAFYTREKIVKDILSLQLLNGGFSLTGEEADADITAMAVQALAPYYSENEYSGLDVKGGVDKALSLLSETQLSSGGYESGGVENSESCAQVAVALCSVGIDPYKDERFVKNGNSVADALLKYQGSGGGFSHTPDGEKDWIAGSQALYAMTAIYRYENGMGRLYDLTDSLNKDNGKESNFYGTMALILFICTSFMVIMAFRRGNNAKNGKK